MIKDCEEKILNDLWSVARIVREAGRQFRAGDKAAARARYRGAHDTLRRAIGTARGCLVEGRLRDQPEILRQFVNTADEFELLEQLVEGNGGR